MLKLKLKIFVKGYGCKKLKSLKSRNLCKHKSI